MKENNFDDIEVIDIKQQKINLKFSKGSQKLVVVNFPTESFNSKFGQAMIKSKLDVQQINFRNQSEGKKTQKPQNIKEIQNLKFNMICKYKPKKIFSFNFMKNRGVKKNYESKIHFLLEISRNGSLLSVADDYTEAKMNVKGGRAEKITTKEIVEIEKRRQDGRRKKFDESHQDPDFKENEDENSD